MTETKTVDKDMAISFLMRDGNLRVPGGRYGHDTVNCAEVAWAAELAYSAATGEDITLDKLENTMGLVVNSHDDIAYLIRQYGSEAGLNPEDYLNGDDLVPDTED